MTNFIKRFCLLNSLSLLILSSCNQNKIETPLDSGVSFTYNDASFSGTYGTKTNFEYYDYSSLKVNKLSNSLRSDFAYGVDASTVLSTEKNGGVYYNEDGKEQDIFEIMRIDGVNFVRFRIWNNPFSYNGNSYGAGEDSTSNVLEMAKRAKRAGMNILLDFHYSDCWADPGNQVLPKAWKNFSEDKLEEAVYGFTKTTLENFSSNNIKIDAVQIGNEVNSGILFPNGKLNYSNTNSFINFANLLKEGIKATKEVFPKAYSVIHFAGTNVDAYKTFFETLRLKGVEYDIVGLSYYPYWHGTISDLDAALKYISDYINKPILILETAYGYTYDYNEYTSNIFNKDLANKAGYEASIESQANVLRDICNSLSKVKNNLGLGVFYWEPGWLPLKNNGLTKYGVAYCANDEGNVSKYGDQKVSWANQGLFSYSGKALPSLSSYKLIKNA
jgi:arabinogalactan endo-1,4-beta-galactosidase